MPSTNRTTSRRSPPTETSTRTFWRRWLDDGPSRRRQWTEPLEDLLGGAGFGRAGVGRVRELAGSLGDPRGVQRRVHLLPQRPHHRPKPTPRRGLLRHVVRPCLGCHDRAGGRRDGGRGDGLLVAPRGTPGSGPAPRPTRLRLARSSGPGSLAGSDRWYRRGGGRGRSLRDRTPPYGGHILGRSILDGPTRRGGVTHRDRYGGGSPRQDPSDGADPDRPRAHPPRDPGRVQPPALVGPRDSGVGGRAALARSGRAAHACDGEALRRVARPRPEDDALDPRGNGCLGRRAAGVALLAGEEGVGGAARAVRGGARTCCW